MKYLVFSLIFLISINHQLLAEDDSDLLENAFNLSPVAQDAYDALHPKKVIDRGLFVSLDMVESEKAKILIGLGAVGLLLAFDQVLMDTVQDHRSSILTNIANVGDTMGTTPFLPGLIMGTMGVGLIFKDEKLKRTAFRTLKAAVISGLVTETLKALTHRSRPDDGQGPYDFQGARWSSNNTSFPSGHSTAAWAVATVFATEYSDEKWVPWVAYSLAAITSWSRVYDERHWSSDVVLGALIGYVTGKLFTNSLFEKRGIIIAPKFGEALGVSVLMPLGKREKKEDPDLLFD